MSQISKERLRPGSKGQRQARAPVRDRRRPDTRVTGRAARSPRSRSFPRQRLFARVDEALRGSAALWISGAPGAGKTTVVRDYVQRRRRRVIWLQVDGGDADPAAFFHSLSAAARPHLRAGARLPPLTFEYRGSLPAFDRHYFDRLWSAVASPCVLVLDNFQEIPAGSAVHRVVSDLIARLPPQTHVIAVSRDAPGPAYARVRLHRQLQTIGNDDLLVTAPEAWGIATSSGAGASLRRADVEQLRRVTGGWMAGLILMLEHPAAGAPGAGPADTRRRELLFEYFAEEILARADADTRHVLLTTAVLPFITRELARSLTTRPRAWHIIERLHQRNYFVSRAAERDVYQFHPLFHEFLRSQLARTRSHAEQRALLQRAGRLLEAAGHGEEALDGYLAAEAWDEAARMLLELAPALAGQGRLAMLDQYIGRIPDASAAPWPWLEYWRGVCRISVDARASYLHFERAFRAFEESDLTGRVLACAGAIDSLVLDWDDFTRTDPWMDWVSARSEQELDSLPRDVYAKCAESMMTALMYRRVQHENFPVWVDRALQTSAHRSTGHSRAAVTFFGLSGFAASTGNVRMMERALAVLRAMADTADGTPLLSIARCYAEGAYHFLRSELDLAASWIERGIELGRSSGVRVWEHELIGCAAHIALAHGDRSVGRRAVSRLASHFDPERRHSIAEHHFSMGWNALEEGDAATAVKHAELAVQALGQTVAFAELICRYVLAQAYFAANRKDEARRELRTGRELAEHSRLPHWVNSYIVLEASFALAEQDESRAVRLLAEALPDMRRNGCINQFGWMKHSMTRLFACALRHGIETSWVRGLIRRRPDAFLPPPADVAAWPWPVRVYALGRFSVRVDDEELRFSSKVQKRPLELLKAIVAFGGVNVREDRLTDALWPDADADAAARSLAVNIHRLRTLIGTDAVQRQQGALSLNPARCWTDVAALEKTVGDVERGRADVDSTRAAAAARSLLDLYQGPFLDGEDDRAWIIAARERVHVKVRRCLQGLTRRLSGADADLAQQCLRRAIDTDPRLEKV